MDSYTIYSTDTFKKVYLTLDKTEQQWILKTGRKLQDSPTGKTLQFNWFREKRYLNKRLYYLVDEERKRVLFLAFATKKEQQRIIDFVVKNMKELLGYLRSL